MFAKWIYLIASIILTIFFLGLAWLGDTLLPLIAVPLPCFLIFVIGWDTYRTLKPIPYVVSHPRTNRTRGARSQSPLQRRREEVNLFTDFISEEEMKI